MRTLPHQLTGHHRKNVFARYLLMLLEDWAATNGHKPRIPSGLRKGNSTVDHGLFL